jgi:predicted DsbA family dithiol-disulfide isomerase
VDVRLRVECWSDLSCPFCALGHHQWRAAIAASGHPDAIEFVPRAFELDPHARLAYDEPLAELLARKYAMSLDRAHALHRQLESQAAALGLTWSFNRVRPGNTFDAHRVVALAGTQGLATPMLVRLFAAYFAEGRLLSDRATLAALASEVGVTGTATALATDAFADVVRGDEADAAERDIAGVPFTLVDGRFAVAGAREVDELVDVLARAWRRRMLEVAKTRAG